jgi:predicted acylesterase/phospholipase RssA
MPVVVAEEFAMARTTVRIALSLNGGVSLAVWMSGVVHELDLICRASRDRNPVAPAADAASAAGAEHDHYRRWQQFCAEKDVEVVVDVIAGTSAGGLNGAFLAKAVACGTALPDLRTLWATEAALEPGKVLWESGTAPVPSVLNGNYFQDILAKTLEDIPTPGEGSPMTLFLTATGFGPSNRRYADAAGGEFDVPDHRRLYRFRFGRHIEYQGGHFQEKTTNEFVTAGAELALAARASAGFPVAFAPVAETPELAQHLHLPPMEETNPNEPTYLMDGGILDNAPLEPVLDEVATRRADARIDRKVVYLVPSNGVLSRAPVRPSERGAPTWVQVAGSALSFPREADFRSDIQQLQNTLRSSRVRVIAATAILADAVQDEHKMRALLAGRDAVLELYRQARITGTLLDIRDDLAARTHAVPRLESSTGHQPALQREASWAQSKPAGWPYGISGAQRTTRVLLSATRNDIEEASAANQTELAERLIALSASLSDVSEKVAALKEAVDADLFDPQSPILHGEPTDDELIAALNTQFNEMQIPEQLDDLINHAVEHYCEAHELDPRLVRQVLEAIEVVTGALAARSEEQAPPPFGFVRLGPDIIHPTFPGGLHDDNKLYGTRLQHFGAFGEKDWRLWDWRWGRLDATAHIARLLAAPRNRPPEGTDSESDAALEAEIAEMEREVIRAEGTTVEKMRNELNGIAEQLRRAAGETDQPLLDQLRGTTAGQKALAALADSVSRFLAQDDTRLPTAVTTVAPYARAAFDRRWRRMPIKQVLARLAFIRTRRTVWRWIDGKGSGFGRKAHPPAELEANPDQAK